MGLFFVLCGYWWFFILAVLVGVVLILCVFTFVKHTPSYCKKAHYENPGRKTQNPPLRIDAISREVPLDSKEVHCEYENAKTLPIGCTITMFADGEQTPSHYDKSHYRTSSRKIQGRYPCIDEPSGEEQFAEVEKLRASEKAKTLLRSHTTTTEEELVAFSFVQAWGKVYYQGLAKKEANQIEACFAGFLHEENMYGEQEQEQLMEFAADAKIKVRKTITKNLDVLVCGPYTTQNTMRRAEEHGAVLFYPATFQSFCVEIENQFFYGTECARTVEF